MKTYPKLKKGLLEAYKIFTSYRFLPLDFLHVSTLFDAVLCFPLLPETGLEESVYLLQIRVVLWGDV